MTDSIDAISEMRFVRAVEKRIVAEGACFADMLRICYKMCSDIVEMFAVVLSGESVGRKSCSCVDATLWPDSRWKAIRYILYDHTPG